MQQYKPIEESTSLHKFVKTACECKLSSGLTHFWPEFDTLALNSEEHGVTEAVETEVIKPVEAKVTQPVEDEVTELVGDELSITGTFHAVPRRFQLTHTYIYIYMWCCLYKQVIRVKKLVGLPPPTPELLGCLS